MASDNMKHRRLQELGESDFEIVEGQPDIRGWDVKSSTGETIGEVDELILDARARKVRYMVVDLDDDALGLESDRTVLIPIGLAQLHENDDEVLLPDVSMLQLKQLPEYDSDHLDDAFERTVSSVLGRTDVSSGSTVADARFYEHGHFNDMNLYQRRLLPASTSGQTDTGGMRFQQRQSETDTTGGMSRSDLTGDVASGIGRVNTFDEEVEEDSLQAVRHNNNDAPLDATRNIRQEEGGDRFSHREAGRNNAEDGTRSSDPV